MRWNSKRTLLAPVATLGLVVSFQNCGGFFSQADVERSGFSGVRGLAVDGGSALSTPFARQSAAWFVPNQIAGNTWYKLDGQSVNGHIEDSFSNLTLWPNLAQILLTNSGGLGIYAAEIGHTSNQTLSTFRAARIATSIEAPGWTQCLDGNVIAQLEINGQSPAGQNLFCSVFGICQPGDRTDPNGRGWFVSKEGSSYAPEEIILDERMPGLLPYYRADDGVLFDGNLSWAERKSRTLQAICPQADSFNAGLDRITGFVYDYVEYARVMRAKFPATDFSFHWNVNPGWEWRDNTCLEGVNARHPGGGEFREVFQNLREPCHRDTDHLARVVSALCADAKCPKAVYMDVDYLYNTGYSVDVLRRNRQVLRDLGVDFGINIVNQCDSVAGSAVNQSADGNSLICVQRDASVPNAANEESLLNAVSFFKAKGLIDASTRLRIGSWSKRPVEHGLGVNENIGASMAGVVNRIFNEQLIPAHFANPPAAYYQPAFGSKQAAGFFQVGSGGIYMSNGGDAYCGIANWADFLRLGGHADLSNVAHPGGLPNGMRADPVCR